MPSNSRTTSSSATPRRRYTVAVWSANSRSQLGSLPATHRARRSTNTVASWRRLRRPASPMRSAYVGSSLVATSSARVAIRRSLRPEPRARRPGTRRQVARREAERGVGHGRRGYRPGPGAYDRSMSDDDGDDPPPSAQRQLDRAPGERYRSRPGTRRRPRRCPVRLAGGAGRGSSRSAVPILVAVASARRWSPCSARSTSARGCWPCRRSSAGRWRVAVVWSGVPAPGARGPAGRVGGCAGRWLDRRSGSWSCGSTPHVEGGVMDPFAYLDERFGPSPIVERHRRRGGRVPACALRPRGGQVTRQTASTGLGSRAEDRR